MKPTSLLRLLAAALLGVLFLGSGCRTVPVTGRSALNTVSDKDVVRLSAAEFADMRKRNRVSTDPAKIARLQRVGERIAEVVFWDVPDADWEFVVFEAPGQVNAFAMAGGKVGVFSGCFDLATTDDELAVIIAHEIAHVTARHVHELLSQQIIQSGDLQARFPSLSRALDDTQGTVRVVTSGHVRREILRHTLLAVVLKLLLEFLRRALPQ